VLVIVLRSVFHLPNSSVKKKIGGMKY